MFWQSIDFRSLVKSVKQIQHLHSKNDFYIIKVLNWFLPYNILRERTEGTNEADEWEKGMERWEDQSDEKHDLEEIYGLKYHKKNKGGY